MSISSLSAFFETDSFEGFEILTLFWFALHLAEEQLWPGKFREWWNRRVWKSGVADFPLTEAENGDMNVAKLLLTAIALVALSNLSHLFLYVLLGFLLADAFQHLGFTVVDLVLRIGEYSPRKFYSPGAWTSLAYLLLVFHGFTMNTAKLHYHSALIIAAMILGFGILGLAYRASYRKVRKMWRERSAF